jgi:hypothetical protein
MTRYSIEHDRDIVALAALAHRKHSSSFDTFLIASFWSPY